ncbi:uncharacterized protein LOC132601223 [Lycium barbarum]|uniref:uncharacterized protein LOC132601223 n=1 Tax=Lycium barbarum TaxID=112863 RepID=UPI00293F43A9|nr:uncharacterized protein LOC132601223 [Lycium barbarum]
MATLCLNLALLRIKRILEEGSYTFNRRPFVLKNWSPDFNIHNQPMRILLLWIMFPRLSLYFWDDENLGRVASYLGCLETRVKQNKASRVKQKFGRDWEFAPNYSFAPNGRIYVGWKTMNVAVMVLSSATQFVYCLVQDKHSTFQSHITFIYGLHTVSNRYPLWDQLRGINSGMIGPWLILGYFNTMLGMDNIINGALIHILETIDFQQCVTNIGVGQVEKTRCQHSWFNKKGANKRIYSLIDCIFGNLDWMYNYIDLKAEYLLPDCSDHSAILVNTEVTRKRCNKPFRLITSLINQKEYQQAKLKDTLRTIQEGLNNDYFDPQLIEEEKITLLLLEKWETIQEAMSRQKSRAAWIAQGDSNTKYFDAHLKYRQAKSRISSICNDQQIKITNLELSQQEFVVFFTKLLDEATTELPTLNVNIIMDGPCLNILQQQAFLQPVTSERLKLVVYYLVGPSQSAFIEGRNILDNVIIAHELIKGYSWKSVSPRCMIKIDINKAYDSIEWPFLRMVLTEFGMPHKLVCLIMECFTTVSDSLLRNGSLTPRFPAKKGLRQGDPMSPCLSVLAMEYLNMTLKQLKLNPNFNFHPKCERLDLLHICFVDDLLLYCRADQSS